MIGRRCPVRLCACLDTLFDGVPVDLALGQVAAQGLAGIEFWDWRGRDPDRLAGALAARGLQAVAFSGNTFAEPLVDARAHGATLVHLDRSLQTARRLGASLLVVHVGYARSDETRAAQWSAAVAGLRAAGARAAACGVTLAVEPLNSRLDHPGYFLDTLPDALALLDEVGHPAVRLLLDLYHLQVMHPDLLARLPAAIPRTAHVHAADLPGRGEPGSGTMPWAQIADILCGGRYAGWIGLECWPTDDPVRALRRAAAALTGAGSRG